MKPRRLSFFIFFTSSPTSSRLVEQLAVDSEDHDDHDDRQADHNIENELGALHCALLSHNPRHCIRELWESAGR